MLKSYVLAAVLVVGLSTTASLAVTIDGAVNPGDGYTMTLTDAANELIYEPGLDIDQVFLGADASNVYLGLTVEGGLFDTNGSNQSFLNSTGVIFAFYADPADAMPYVVITLAFNPLGFDPSLSFFREWNGAGYTNTTINNPLLYDVSPDSPVPTSAMEIALSNTYFQHHAAGLPGFVRVQLDDTGGAPDDQLTGLIPEPATMSLLAMGGLALLRRRNR